MTADRVVNEKKSVDFRSYLKTIMQYTLLYFFIQQAVVLKLFSPINIQDKFTEQFLKCASEPLLSDLSWIGTHNPSPD